MHEKAAATTALMHSGTVRLHGKEEGLQALITRVSKVLTAKPNSTLHDFVIIPCSAGADAAQMQPGAPHVSCAVVVDLGEVPADEIRQLARKLYAGWAATNDDGVQQPQALRTLPPCGMYPT